MHITVSGFAALVWLPLGAIALIFVGICVVTAFRPAQRGEQLLWTQPPPSSPISTKLAVLRGEVKRQARFYVTITGPVLGLMIGIIAVVGVVVSGVPLVDGVIVVALITLGLTVSWEVIAFAYLLARYQSAKRRIFADELRS